VSSLAKTIGLAVDVSGVVNETAERFGLDLLSKIVMFHYDDDTSNKKIWLRLSA